MQTKLYRQIADQGCLVTMELRGEKGWSPKGHDELFEGEGRMHYVDSDGGFTSASFVKLIEL